MMGKYIYTTSIWALAGKRSGVTYKIMEVVIKTCNLHTWPVIYKFCIQSLIGIDKLKRFLHGPAIHVTSPLLKYKLESRNLCIKK